MSNDTHPQSRQGLAIAAASAALTLAVFVTAGALLGIIQPAQSKSANATTNPAPVAAPIAPQPTAVEPEPIAEMAPDLAPPEARWGRGEHHEEEEHEHGSRRHHEEEHDDD